MSSPSARDKPKSPIFTCRERIELFGLSDKYMYDIMPSESIAIYSNKKQSDLIVYEVSYYKTLTNDRVISTLNRQLQQTTTKELYTILLQRNLNK